MVSTVSGAAVGFIAKEVNRVVALFLPWSMLVIAPVLSLIFYTLWYDYHSVTVAFFMCAAVLLGAFSYRLTHARGIIGKTHTVISAVGVTAWVGLAAVEGFWTRPALDLLLAGGILLSVMWNFRSLIRAKDDEESISWPKVAEASGLEGVRWKNIPTAANKINGLLKLKKGQTFDDVSKKRQSVASALGVPENAVRMNRDPDNARHVFMSAVREDFLRKEIAWKEPGFKGGSIADGPIHIGTYEDGEPAELNLYSPGGARHLLISGMNGAGKSVGARVILTDLFSRTDVAVWAIDTVKGKQTLGCAIDGLDWFITEKPVAEATLDQLLGVIKARADFLGNKGLDVWQPGCGLTYMVVLIEEAPDVVRDADSAIRIVERARSTGISLIISIQRASYNNMPTDLRAQLGTVLCFGVKTDIDARFALSDDAVERGADPSLWQQRKPGYAYLQAPEIDEDREVVPLRVFNISTTEVMDNSAILQSDPLDDVSRRAAGKLYEEHRDDKPVVVVNAEGNAVIDGEVIKDEELPEEEPQTEEEILELVKQDDEDEMDVDIDEPVEGLDDPNPAPIVVEGQRLKPEDARRVFSEAMEQLKSEGRRKVTPKDFYDILKKVGRTRPWLHQELNRNIDIGTLRYTDDNKYYIV